MFQRSAPPSPPAPAPSLGGGSPGIFSQTPKGCKQSSKVICTSTGLPSFDDLLLMPNGIPLESNILLKEDITDFISNSSSISLNIMKAFIASAFLLEQDVIFIDGCQTEDECKKCGPLSALPSPKTVIEEVEEVEKENSQMQIAWRYSNLKISSSSKTNNNSFDFGKRVKYSKSKLVKYYSVLDDPSIDSMTTTTLFEEIEMSIKDAHARGTVVRLVIRGLGSPFWSSITRQIALVNSIISLCKRNKSPLLASIIGIDGNRLSGIESQFDCFWQIQNIRKEDLTLKDYAAFLKLSKPLRIPQTLSLKIPESTSLAIKFERKRFLSLQIFHMPPSIDVVENSLEF